MRPKLAFLILTLATSLTISAFAAEAQTSGGMAVIKTFEIGGKGRWDYLTCDATGKFLYVTRSTHVMVIATDSGKVVADIDGLKGCHGTALVPALHRAFVSDGEDASVLVFDTDTNKVLGKVKADDDADGIIYDPDTHRVIVGCGDAKNAVIIPDDVNPASGSAAGTLAVGGKPEFIAADGQGHAYINSVSGSELIKFDPVQIKELNRWPVAPGASPTSLAIDPATHRLFIGCRNNTLLMMNSDTGEIVATQPIGKGVDATAFVGGKVFVSCREGTLWVFDEKSPSELTLDQKLATGPGAGTLAVNPVTHEIYLPSADFAPVDPSQPSARLKPIEGTFKILVVGSK